MKLCPLLRGLAAVLFLAGCHADSTNSNSTTEKDFLGPQDGTCSSLPSSDGHVDIPPGTTTIDGNAFPGTKIYSKKDIYP